MEATWRTLTAVVERARLAEALHAACGPRGRRRFVVRFDARARVRLTGVEAEPLAGGGGPPPPARLAAATGGLERALAALRAGLPAGWTFARGAVGVVRDGDGGLVLTLRLDEDADELRLDDLELPGGAPHPLEDPAWLRALGDWEPRVRELRAQWRVPGPEGWRLADGRLSLGAAESHRAVALARWSPGPSRFEWLLDEPVGEEAPLVEPALACDLAEASELAAYAAVRRGDRAVFQGTTVEGDELFVALR